MIQDAIIGYFQNIVIFSIMFIGLYILVSSDHYIKKIIGINIFQSSIFLFYISMGKIVGGTPPILSEHHTLYSNPLPQALILTAIVVSFGTTAVGYALCAAIKRTRGTLGEKQLITLSYNAFLNDEKHVE